MRVEMNMNTFNKIFNENGWREAMKYKDNFVPKFLYKYYPIFDDRYVDYDKENESRFDSLSNNKIWVSSYKRFNDPFEFKMLTLHREMIESSNWEIEFIEKYLDAFKDRTLIACFSCVVENNMPLWAHYASNHSGYCVKYAITNPKNIFPVSYEPIRTKMAVIPTMIISELIKSYNQNLKEPTEDFYKYFTYLYFSFTCKHVFWEYENEFRLLFLCIDPVDGLSVPLKNVGLAVEGIYLGCKCKDIYKQKLTSIGRKLKCDVFEMYFDEYSEAYELNIKKIL